VDNAADRSSGAPTGLAWLSRRISGTHRVWMLTVVLFAAAFFIASYEMLDGAPRTLPFLLPWPLIALCFYVVETKVVHLHIGQSAHSFSMAEIPLVVGVFFLDPVTFIVARTLGGGLALLVSRRQRSVKLAFNVAQFTLGAVVATGVVHSLAGTGTGFGLGEWVIGYVATIAENLTAVLAIATAISLAEGRPQLHRIPEMVRTGLFVSLTNASLALLGIVIIQVRADAMLLLLVPTSVVYVAYRAYVEQRQQKEGLEMLYESTRILQRTPEAERAVAELLAHVRTMFRAEVAELTIVATHDGEEHLRATSRGDDPAAPMVTIGVALDDPLLQRAIDERMPKLIALADPASEPRFRNAMVAPLIGEHRVIGTLVVADRLSDISTFDLSDLRLFETLTSHIAVSLENDQLEQSLHRLAKLKDELNHQANHDSLTGLGNRALFTDAVNERLAATYPGGRVLVVLFLDLDDFKIVNDTRGHPAGDALLRAVGQRISATVRGDDIAARLGGDEFAVVLWDREDLVGVRRLASRLLDTFADPFIIDSQLLSVRASIGVAANFAGRQSCEDLMKNADVAMYVAKASGKGRVVMFEPSMAAALQQETETVSSLKRAITAGELVLHYQPVFNLETGDVVGTEALVRWNHPTRGFLAPAEFIGIAERSDLIVDLGEWVLCTALAQLRRWQDRGEPFRSWWMSVNVSSRQLDQGNFVARVDALVQASGVTPGSLALELTESGLIANAEEASEKLKELRELGVGLLIDDFGTGYSSLAYLQRFPVSTLKIAREFVDIDPGPAGEWGLAATVIAMAKTLGLDVIAEGVEQPGQLQRLKDLGCPLAQGFLLARPVPAETLEALLFPGEVVSSSSPVRDAAHAFALRAGS
jgi:diguanylate cyclase (GGDEF)-like protein